MRAADLSAFLKNDVIAHFGERLHFSNCEGPSLIRSSGYFAQGFTLYRLQAGEVFRIYLHTRCLVLPKELAGNITLTTLRTRRQPSSFLRVFGASSLQREMWIEWPRRFERLEEMVAAINEQLLPPMYEEITLQSMFSIIGREPGPDESFSKAWARAVMSGLEGDLELAKSAMSGMIDYFDEMVRKYSEGDNLNSAKDRVYAEMQRLERARQMLKAMGSQTGFIAYCNQAAKESAEAFGLVLSH